MFGHQDDQSQQDQSDAPAQSDGQNPQITEPGQDLPDPSLQPTPSDNTQVYGDASDSNQADVISPAGGYPKAPEFQPGGFSAEAAPSGHGAEAMSTSTDETTHELIDIKQHALTELLPLIDKLDQTPAERFRTLLMMIQASDDQHLVKAAYESAHKIEDEKVRARALLDIVNEINYFTQQPANQTAS